MPHDNTHSLPNSGKRALHFGAGNIGRGFIGPLLSQSGYNVVFADVNEHLVQLLNDARQYTLELVSNSRQSQVIEDVEGLLSTDPQLTEMLSQSGESAIDLITTSVGASVLPKLADAIAAGFERRAKNKGGYVNVIACENLQGATDKLAEAVLDKLSGKSQVLEWVDANVGWVNCAVDRIVPNFETSEKASDLDVGAEPFFEWIADKSKVKGQITVQGLTLVDDLRGYIERKLYTLNCGHAALAYLGFLRGYRTVYDSMKDEEIQGIIREALKEAGQGLSKRHGFKFSDHEKYIELVLKRFANPVLEDDVERIGREPLRKLGPTDRLVGPTNMLREYELPRDHLLIAIAAALHFRTSGDEESIKLYEMIQEHGVEEVLRDVCGWNRDRKADAIDMDAVLKHYRNLGQWKRAPSP